MAIQITSPEVEALINQRLQSDAFRDAEDMILKALQSSVSATTPDAPPARDIVNCRWGGIDSPSRYEI